MKFGCGALVTAIGTAENESCSAKLENETNALVTAGKSVKAQNM
jgi:hypothetical protein